MRLTTPVKLGAFAAALALLFGAAALAGGAVEPLHANVSASADGMMGADAMGVRGLGVSDDSFTLHLARRTAQQDKTFQQAFRITDKNGATVTDFDIEHTKRMHFIVVRRDMTDFQHVHPTEGSDGTWRVPLTLHEAGSYRVFADFAVDGVPHTLADDISANGAVTWQSLPKPSRVATTDGFKVQLTEGPAVAGKESTLNFTVTRKGQPIHTQNYLGAKGHLVALRQGDLAFLHVHPAPDTLDFDAAFPSPGAYRLFLQFKVDGQVHTAEFTQEVSR